MSCSGYADSQRGWEGDDEITMRENHSAFHRIWLRPRVLVNVKEATKSTISPPYDPVPCPPPSRRMQVDVRTRFLGQESEMPVFLSAVCPSTALALLPRRPLLCVVIRAFLCAWTCHCTCRWPCVAWGIVMARPSHGSGPVEGWQEAGAG
jgi:hypothetical protein